jgi:glycolate oxidase FAD binding subunit
MSGRAPPAPDTGALRSELGGLWVDERPPIELAGCRLQASIRPESGEALSHALASLHRAKTSVVVRGSGTRIAQGNPARGASLLLSTTGIAGVDELDAEDGVVHAGAGTPLADLAQQAEAAGWTLPLDPPGATTTLGGALASAASGPRALSFGPARDAVLGLEVALATGERTRCGGRVVKNVTGYDLAKLYVGSMGTLGVIESAWLRLRPLPRARRVQVAGLPADPNRAFALALETARRGTAQAVALLDSALALREPQLAQHLARADGWLLVAELAGDAAACAADAEWLAGCGATEPDDASLIERVRSLQSASIEGRGIHARLHLLPSALPAAASALRAEGAELMVYPVPGVLHAWIATPDVRVDGPGDASGYSPWLTTVLDHLDALRRAHDGSLFIEALPDWSDASAHDVFGATGSSLALMRALKQRFDPADILNPGRFAGGL